MNDIYEQLRQQLDQYSIGFPATQSGIELEILRKLFTPEQAELYLQLSMLLETPDSVAKRLGKDCEEVADQLETMAQQGLLFRKRKGEVVKYAAVPFVIGAYEFQLKSMDRELAELVEKYFEEGFFSSSFGQQDLPLPLRTIPINTALDARYQVEAHENAREIIKTKKVIAVANCICRTQQGFLDKGCDKPLETCLLFGSHAEFYVENKMARFIDQEEALAILDRSQEAGLVCQPANMINPGGMCNCCGDCCGVLRALKRLDRPADVVTSSFVAQVDQELCVGCGECQERCQMEAIALEDDQARVLEQRCIGCGLCVSTCPTEAMTLQKKECSKAPPASGVELMSKAAEVRGTKLVPLAMQKE